MTQLSPSLYKRLSPQMEYDKSDGLYWDVANSKVVVVIDDAIKASVDTNGAIDAGDLEGGETTFSGQARGQIIRSASATAMEVLSAKTSGQVVCGDGTDVISAPITGDVSAVHSGGNLVTSVGDLSIASEARGDLVRRGATVWERVAAKTSGQLVSGDGTDVISAPVTGEVGLVASAGNLVATAKHATKWPFRIPSLSGKDTDAKNGGMAGCDQALDITATEASATFCQVYDASAAGFAALETTSAADFVQWQLFPNNTQNTDLVHFGKATKFCELWFDMSATVQTYTGDGTAWKYWNGSAWYTLVVNDYTDASAQDGKRSFGRDGAVTFQPPTDWAATAVNGVTGYWIQVVPTAANISAVGITNGKRHYTCSPTDGFKVPHACTITDIAIRDEAATIHAANNVVFFMYNFTTGAHSGALTFALSKRNDAFASLTMACAAGDILGLVIMTEDGTNEIGPFTLELGVTLT